MTDMTPNQITNSTNQKNMESNKMTPDHSASLHQKIKETWPKLSDGDAKLYMQNQKKFFEKLKSTHHVDKMDAQRKISDFKKELPEPKGNEKHQEAPKSTSAS